MNYMTNQPTPDLKRMAKALDDLVRRTSRIETRLCALAEQLGLDEALHLNINEPSRLKQPTKGY